jgi:chaperonin GroES
LIRPLNSGVIVEPRDLADKTSGGVALPDTVRGRSNEGIVRAVGRGHFHAQSGTYVPLDVEVGQRVLFLRWSGYLITHNGKQLIRVEENEILCEVDKNDEAELQGMIVKK